MPNKEKSLKLFPIVCILIIGLVFLSLTPLMAKKPIKCAILAPQGSTWMNVLEDWNKDLKAKTKDAAAFKFYSSGSMGDENTVLRKMRSGQIDAAGFSGIGLGQIVPEVRLMELPFMFESYKQVDYVVANMEEFYRKKFEEKGFVLLCWSETGFVYILSNKPIRAYEDLKGVKMWRWEGDEMVDEVFKLFKIPATPLAITDVLTSLQTKLIDGVYISPVAGIALQWTTKVKYMLSTKMAFSVGAMIITKKSWDGLGPDEQQALRDTGKLYGQKLTEILRTENEKAKETIKASGIEFVEATPEAVKFFQDTSFNAAQNLVGKLYSKDLLDKVRELRNSAPK
jgi:TRAP-type C4-dicarboxylate transport system substrate-binding protein